MTGSSSGASVLHKIKEVAKRDGREVQALTTTYVVERFLARLAVVDTDGRVTIKGGQSLSIIFGNSGRPTKDLDVNVHLPDVADPISWCEDLMRRVVSLDLGDGVILDLANVRYERRNHQAEGGLRVTVPASVHSCRVPLVIDVGVNNEMSFAPTIHDHAGVLADAKSPFPPVGVKIYPFENTVAEKIVSKIEDGAASIRHKDFFDIWFAVEVGRRIGDYSKLLTKPKFLTPLDAITLSRVRRGIREGTLLEVPVIGIEDSTYDKFSFALSRTASSRGTALPDDLMCYFRSEFGDDEAQSVQWANWCLNNRKRLLFQPPGTDAAGDKTSSFQVLFDNLEPFFGEINSRLQRPSPVVPATPGF
ncbi:nucleotidyl transferase AbiEii/AbiGii toxin family protein [Rhizobium sp. BK176]|uniref:nucleotidyl transferase AbiEii/AbiGii toxin family protein n=1 Tax=Rhizobium sp. BK176 TaxID=2587071 RepID=UPI002166C830|nr:nucleotidyl transferase AbiEii/AbiGii toxin family protein [Rhizobium sp. BK176]MCS4089014.1 hypothetical protein [Rhizobium sp. BK176]